MYVKFLCSSVTSNSMSCSCLPTSLSFCQFSTDSNPKLCSPDWKIYSCRAVRFQPLYFCQFSSFPHGHECSHCGLLAVTPSSHESRYQSPGGTFRVDPENRHIPTEMFLSAYIASI